MSDNLGMAVFIIVIMYGFYRLATWGVAKGYPADSTPTNAKTVVRKLPKGPAPGSF